MQGQRALICAFGAVRVCFDIYASVYLLKRLTFDDGVEQGEPYTTDLRVYDKNWLELAVCLHLTCAWLLGDSMWRAPHLFVTRLHQMIVYGADTGMSMTLAVAD